MKNETKREIAFWTGIVSILSLIGIGIDQSVGESKYKLLNFLKDCKLSLTYLENLTRERVENGEDFGLVLAELGKLQVDSSYIIAELETMNKYKLYVNYLRKGSELNIKLDKFFEKFKSLKKQVED